MDRNCQVSTLQLILIVLNVLSIKQCGYIEFTKNNQICDIIQSPKFKRYSMKKFLVGGAVRDLLMGVKPKDQDYVVIGETVESMEALGFKQVGKDFPVFLHPETGEEYALARRERKTGDGYNGFSVDTENVTLEEDLSRRDFAMNSIAMNLETGEVIDPFGGWEDIKNKIIRHTSDAFVEDPLRVIRLARFAARYCFQIAPETATMARDLVSDGHLNHIPFERFWLELDKVFACERAELFFDVLFDYKVHNHVNFFRELVGNAHLDDVEGFAYVTRFFPAEDRLDYFCAILAHETITIFPTTRSKRLGEAARYNRCMDFDSAESVYGLLLKLDTFREGYLADDFGKILPYLEFNKLEVNQYSYMVRRTREVHSSMFPDVIGKELGEAIKAERIKIIAEVLEW